MKKKCKKLSGRLGSNRNIPHQIEGAQDYIYLSFFFFLAFRLLFFPFFAKVRALYLGNVVGLYLYTDLYGKDRLGYALQIGHSSLLSNFVKADWMGLNRFEYT